jgi:hypothetical protein
MYIFKGFIFLYGTHFWGSRVSSGSIVFDYGMDDRAIPGEGKGFFL